MTKTFAAKLAIMWALLLFLIRILESLGCCFWTGLQVVALTAGIVATMYSVNKITFIKNDYDE